MGRFPHLFSGNSRDALWVFTLFTRGVGIWGINTSVVWGFRDRELRLVDRHRQRGHPDLVSALAHAPVLARLDQPFRRSDDAFRSLDRGPVPDLSSRAPALFLLARALPIDRCRFGRNGGAPSFGISGRSPAISCSRSSSGMSACCPISPPLRDRSQRRLAEDLRRLRRSAGVVRRGTGAITTRSRSRSRRWRRRSCVRSIRSLGSTSLRA